MKINTTLATVVAVTLMGSALCHAQEDKKKIAFDKLDADKAERSLWWNTHPKSKVRKEKRRLLSVIPTRMVL